MEGTLAKAMIAAWILAGGLGSLGKTPSKAGIEPDLKVVARVYDYAHVGPTTIALAEREAEGIFRHAGLSVEWQNISVASGESGSAASLPSTDSVTGVPSVFLRITPSSMSPIDHRETLGCALASSDDLPGSAAWVFSDRIEAEAGLGIATSYQILGHAMAHEIGHLLLGRNAHSVAGLMRANWRVQEYILMGERSLRFTPEQAKTMRDKLKQCVQSHASPEVAGAAVRR